MQHINHTRQTIAFFLAGLVISGFTASVLVWIHSLFSLVINNCIFTWQMLWALCGILALLCPRQYLKKYRGRETRAIFWLFLLLEYLLMQGAFTPLYTDTRLMCYSQGGQNGLEMALAAWTGYLPMLIIAVYIDRSTLKAAEEEENDDDE